MGVLCSAAALAMAVAVRAAAAPREHCPSMAARAVLVLVLVLVVVRVAVRMGASRALGVFLPPPAQQSNPIEGDQQRGAHVHQHSAPQREHAQRGQHHHRHLKGRQRVEVWWEVSSTVFEHMSAATVALPKGSAGLSPMPALVTVRRKGPHTFGAADGPHITGRPEATTGKPRILQSPRCPCCAPWTPPTG